MTGVARALRAWAATPGAAACALCALVLGMGATTALGTLIYSLSYRPLPVADPDSLWKVADADGDAMYSREFFDAFAGKQQTFASVAAAAPQTIVVRAAGESRTLRVTFVSREFFSTLGVRMVRGRSFEARDVHASARPVIVISDALWQGWFAGEPAVLGSELEVGEARADVVGMADPSFGGVEIGRRSDVYALLDAEPAIRGAASVLLTGNRWLHIFGRSPPDSHSKAQLEASLGSWSGLLADENRWFGRVPGRSQDAAQLRLRRAHEGISPLREQYRESLNVLFTVIVAMLAMASVNVGILMLVRTHEGERDRAVRAALGAGRRHLLAPMWAEAAVVTVAGGLAGGLLGHWLASSVVPSLVTALDRGRPPYLPLSVEPIVLLLGVAVVAAATVAAAAIPSVSVMFRRDVTVTALDGSRMSSSGRAGGMRKLLVVQIAIAIAMLCTAGSLARSFYNVVSQSLAIDSDGVLLAAVEGPAWGVTETDTRLRLEQMEATLSAIPTVEAVSLSVLTPLSGIIMLGRVEVPGFVSNDIRDVSVSVNRVSSGFLRVFGTSVLTGRGLEPGDGAGAPLVTVINTAFRDRYFDSTDPIGRHITIDDRDVQIVGMVESGKYKTLREPSMAFAYVPLTQWIGPRPQPIRIGIRGSRGQGLRGEIVSAMRELDPRLSVEFRTLADDVHTAASRERLLAAAGLVAAALAAAIASLGLFSTLSFIVARRRIEIGVRLAMGAPGHRILLSLARELQWVIAIGVLAGLAGANLASQALRATLFGMTGFDGLAAAGAVVLLAAVSAAAAFQPMSRALKLDPAILFRGGLS